MSLFSRITHSITHPFDFRSNATPPLLIPSGHSKSYAPINSGAPKGSLFAEPTGGIDQWRMYQDLQAPTNQRAFQSGANSGLQRYYSQYGMGYDPSGFYSNPNFQRALGVPSAGGSPPPNPQSSIMATLLRRGGRA